MSKLTRVLVVGAMTAAMNLAGMAAIAQTTEAGAVEQFRRGERASQERSDTFPQTPAQVPAPVPDEPNGQPGWLVVSLGLLAAAMALVAGLAMLVAKRATRRARLGPVA